MEVLDLAQSNEKVGCILKMNTLFKDFLVNEGKWLGGGFESVFSIQKEHRFGPVTVEVKRDIFMMLPGEIRAHINRLGLGIA
ncbi:hypothetical protein [Sphingobacterium lactis]|uniref:Uncharacterized protein n=1 Tax=Sphingobacterium lactis TaxID=797291 RepID=A0A1H5Y4G6_9SPHI|nr:hypothetical protein [Sphingobacterium lactis]SEG18788.1 hypothetical protein SAMN05421877_105234 [Sphingobacterium lactis]